MLARALIVLLVVLNLGVAAWWASGRDAPVEQAIAPQAGVQRLRLLSEVPAAQQPPPATLPPSAAVASTIDPTAVPPAAVDADALVADPLKAAADKAATDKAATDKAIGDKAAADTAAIDKAAVLAANGGGLPPDARCLALGPFADDAAADAARERLRPQVLQLRDRRVMPPSTRGWRVWLPPLADRDAAQAMAARITAAGFSDLFVLTGGDDGNGIALGRFGSEGSARQREAALQAAGFSDVRAAALDAQPPQRWIDIAAAAGVDAAALRSVAASAKANPVACATLR